jgi:protein tyrosine phosphatase (PTP) superfamily phosphohydrolase (DUF442 family)
MGAIDEAVLDQVAQDGYKSVLNLRKPTEANLEKEEELSKARGLEYAHVAVDASAEGIDAATVRKAAETLHNLPQPAFVHCAGGGRASAVVLAHNALYAKNPATFQAWLDTAASNGYVYNPSWHKSLQSEFFP